MSTFAAQQYHLIQKFEKAYSSFSLRIKIAINFVVGCVRFLEAV